MTSERERDALSDPHNTPTTKPLPLTDEERQPIWAAVQDLGCELSVLRKRGRCPPWVGYLEVAIGAAQMAMDAEFYAEKEVS